MDPVALEVGPLAIRWYGILIGCALALGTFLAYREGVRRGVNPDHILNLVLVIAPAAIIGARIYYVIFSWADYAGDGLWEMFAIWHGGLAIHGGLIGGTLAGSLYIRKHGLKFWEIADTIAPGLILGQAIGRWGNFFNQEAHGGPVSSQFISRFPEFIQKGMLIEGTYYNPTFLYESAWDFAVFLFLLWLGSRKRLPGGVIFLAYLALYSLGRFYIEGLRTDSLMLGPYRVAQLVSLLIVFLGTAELFRRLKGRKIRK